MVRWKAVNALLFSYFRDELSLVEESQAAWQAMRIENSRQAVFFGCRAGQFPQAYATFNDCLLGAHGSSTLDNYPKVGSHTENLAILKAFFGDDHWEEPLSESKKLLSKLLRTVAFSLRTQGQLAKSLTAHRNAQRAQMETADIDRASIAQAEFPEVTIDNAEDLLSVGTLYGLITKVLVLQGNFAKAIEQAKLGTKLIGHVLPFVNSDCHASKDANDTSLEAKIHGNAFKFYTAIEADLAAAYHHNGDVEQATQAFERSRQDVYYSSYPILRAERMVQYCEFLLDKGDYEEVIKATKAADEFCELNNDKDGVPLRNKAMLLDYAINGYIYGRAVAEQFDQQFWNERLDDPPSLVKSSETVTAPLADILERPQDLSKLKEDYVRNNRRKFLEADQSLPCFGDLAFAMVMLERIGRQDWLPKVYCVASMACRLISTYTKDDTESDRYFKDANDFLCKAERTIKSYEGQEVQQKIFFADYLVERARFKTAFASPNRFTASESLAAIDDAEHYIKEMRYRRYTEIEDLYQQLLALRSISTALMAGGA